MTLTPERLDVWLLLLRRFAMALIGIVGLTISLIHYWITNEVSLPAFAAFTSLLGLNALNLGRGSTP